MSTEPPDPTSGPAERESAAEPADASSGAEPAHTPSAAEGSQPPAAGEVSASSPATDSETHAAEPDEGDHAPAQVGTSNVPEADGAPKKKRRRRRKKRPDAGTGDATTGEATAAAAPDGPPQRESHEHRKPQYGEHRGEHRGDHRGDHRGESHEWHAFNVGDVVFGKIIEILDEALILDLSGKGHAIFDRVELTLPEEPAQGGADDDDNEDDGPLEEVVAKAKTLAGDATARATQTTEQGPTDVAAAAQAAALASAVTASAVTAPAVTAPAVTAPAETAPAVTAPAETAPAETAPADSAPAETAPVETAPPDVPNAARHEHERRAEPPIVVVLPPVTMELGASFVGVVHNDGGRGGLVVLTRHPRRVRAAKPLVALAFKEHTRIKALVTGAIKGGIEADIDGLRAFAPASHVELRYGADLHHLIGKRLEFEVTQYGKRGRDVVLSRRSMLEAEAKAMRTTALARLVPGTVVDGIVRSVVPFGAFVDVGGIEGLIPLSEMSHNRSDQPSDVFDAGQTLQVQVQRIDVKGKIWLSRKAILPDPWVEAVKRYEVGSRHKGKVARIQPFGVFVELEPGIDGLIHIADLSIKPINHPDEVVKVGEEIEVAIASTEAETHRIALHPVLPGMPEGEPIQKIALHKIVTVVVVAIDPGGLQVRVLGATGRHARGFITSAGTGTPRGTELRRLFPVGSKHEAKIIDIDPRRGDVKLSLKAVQEDSERTAYKTYRQQVTREAKFGTFADLLAKKTDKPS